MVTDGPLLLYERLSGAGAGWGNQTFPAALLGGVGLLAFPDSQSPRVGGSSTGGTGFCARGPVGQPSQGELCREGQGPESLILGTGLACFVGCLCCPVFGMSVNWRAAGQGAGRQPPECLRGSGTLRVDSPGEWPSLQMREDTQSDLSDLPKVTWLVGSK